MTAGAAQGTLSLPGQPASLSARVHPLVLYAVCDAFIRRNEGQQRVVGALLGSISADGVVDVRNCYVVPHNESNGQVALDVEYHKSVLELHLRVSPKDVLVGWLSTGSGLCAADAALHDFFCSQGHHHAPGGGGGGGGAGTAPLHLAFDTAFADPGRAARAWVGQLVLVGGQAVATSFLEVPLAFAAPDAHRAGVALLTATAQPAPVAPPHPGAPLAATLQRLHSLLSLSAAYAQAVVDGSLPADPALGRALSSALEAIPRLPGPQFDGLMADAVQDTLLAMHLAALTRTHTLLAARLNTPALL